MIDATAVIAFSLSMAAAPDGPCAPAWSPMLGGMPGADGLVKGMAVWDDGTGPALYVTGAFTTIGGVAANRVARWNGTVWSPLGTGLNGDGITMVGHAGSADLPAGLYVGGWFTTAGGVTVNRIARWNGSSWSALGTGTASNLWALAIFDEGSGPRLFAGGEFTSIGGVAANRIARWNGATWSALGSGCSELVMSLDTHDDGSGTALYVGGAFQQAGGLTVNRIAKWNGAAWAGLATGANGNVRAIASYPSPAGQRLIIGGDFANVGGVPAARIASWDGSAWTQLGPGLPGASVKDLEVIDDGLPGAPALYAGGSILNAGGSSGAHHVARWNGISWDPIVTGMTFMVNALAGFAVDDSEPQIPYAGGQFNTVSGKSALRIAKFVNGAWTPIDDGFNAGVNDAIVFGSGANATLVATGDFTAAAGNGFDHIVAWNGTTWSSLGSGFDDDGTCLELHDDGSGLKLYAGGEFTTVSGVAIKRIARWNGVSWAAVGVGFNSNAVWDLASIDLLDGAGPQLYAGGNFLSSTGIPQAYLARWNGTSWNAVGAELGGPVNAIIAFDDGTGFGRELYVGGSFTAGGGTTLNRIARLRNGIWTPVGNGFPGPSNPAVNSLAVYRAPGEAAASLYAGGSFEPGSGPKFMARWNGSSWVTVGTGVNAIVHSLAVHDDGAGSGPVLVAGGNFTNAGGSANKWLARWNGTSWSNYGGSFSSGVGFVRSLMSLDGTRPWLVIGGDFGASPALDSFLTSHLGCDITCPADIDHDRMVDGDDLGRLLGNWGSTAWATDLNDDGTTDELDLDLLLDAWGSCD